jgi:hypothetical protein
MYVDDGAIVTSGVTHHHAAATAAQGLEHVTGWLARNGLRIDPDKTEFILFDHPQWAVSTHGAPFTHLDLRTPDLEFHVFKREAMRDDARLHAAVSYMAVGIKKEY